MSELDNLAGGIVAVAVGGAAAAGIEPILEPARQQAWIESKAKVLDVGALAQLVAQAIITQDDARKEAERTGYNANKLAALVQLALEAVPVAEALDLRRREKITDDQLTHALEKAQIEPQYWPALRDLVDERLNPETMANAVQQDFVPSAGLLGAIVEGPPFDPPPEKVQLDTLKEFASEGINKDRAQVLALLAGNPPAPQELAQMVMRNQISEDTFIHGLREGRTKTKWAKAMLYYLTHPLLTPGTLVQRRLRGYDTPDVYHTRMARHGYTAAQADDWFEASGRPLAPQQMLDLIARKGPSPTGNGDFTFADFKQGMVESDIKPKYSSPAEALYFKYPPLFQLRRAVESGGMTKERARAIMHIERYEPQDIESLLDSWHVSTTALTSKPDPYVAKSQTQLWTTLHASYKAFESDDAIAREGLGLLGVPPEAQDLVLLFWQAERDLRRKQLTAAQIKKAYLKPIKNETTGLPWTREDALTALIHLGYTLNDANEFLNLK